MQPGRLKVFFIINNNKRKLIRLKDSQGKQPDRNRYNVEVRSVPIKLKVLKFFMYSSVPQRNLNGSMRMFGGERIVKSNSA